MAPLGCVLILVVTLLPIAFVAVRRGAGFETYWRMLSSFKRRGERRIRAPTTHLAQARHWPQCGNVTNHSAELFAADSVQASVYRLGKVEAHVAAPGLFP